MTSTPVSDIAKNVMQGVYAGKNAGLKGGMQDNFSSYLSQADKAGTVSAKTEKTYETTQTAQSGKSGSYEKCEQADKGTEQLKQAETAETDGQDVKEAVPEEEGKIKAELAKKLDISVEELEKLMAELGLCLADLADPANMIALMGSLMPETDAITVMTDETVFADVTELTKFVETSLEETAEELGITVEEFTELIKDAAVEKQGAFVTETVTVEEEPQLQQEEQKTAYIVNDTREEKTTDNVKAEAETAGTAIKETPQKGETDRMADGHDRQNRHGFGAGAEQTAPQQTSFNVDVMPKVTQDISFAQAARTQEILDQIAEYVRVNAKPEVTEMEIRLNPASLGTVNLQVAAKDGVITAQLIAQNEAVKQALESQAYVLRENLESQGIKVEAVEVTVASHEFEQNLENQGGQSEAEQQYAEELKKGTRHINLEGMSEEEIAQMSDDMTEAEIIQLDMMNRNGNKIDFMA